MMIPKTESKVKTITIKTGYGTPYAPIKIPEKYTSGFYLEWLIDEDQKSRLTQVIDLMKVIQRSLWPKKVVAEDDLVFELHGNSLWMGMFYNIDEDIVSRMSVGKKKKVGVIDFFGGLDIFWRNQVQDTYGEIFLYLAFRNIKKFQKRLNDQEKKN